MACLIALFSLVAAIRIWKVNVATSLLHDTFNVVAALADDMRMLGVRHFNLHCHSSALSKSIQSRLCCMLASNESVTISKAYAMVSGITHATR